MIRSIKMSEEDIWSIGIGIQHEKEAREITWVKVKDDPMMTAVQQEWKATDLDWSSLEASPEKMSLRR